MIEDSIRAKAILVAALTDIIGNQFHLTTKHNSKDKYVLLRVTNDVTPIELHDEDNQSEASIQFDCYSKRAATAKLIAKQIDLIFNKKGYEDNEIKVQSALKQGRIPDFETDSGLYRESLDYVFYYNKIEV